LKNLEVIGFVFRFFCSTVVRPGLPGPAAL
jgi:hypothetical protein